MIFWAQSGYFIKNDVQWVKTLQQKCCAWAFSFKFEFKSVNFILYYMNSKKDSKRQKPKAQTKVTLPTEKFQHPSVAPQNLDQDLLLLESNGTLTLRHFEDSFSQSIYLRNTTTQMEIINTPANLYKRKSYLDQIDDAYKEISQVLQWEHKSAISSEDDQMEEDDFSQSEIKQVSENQEESPEQLEPPSKIQIEKKQTISSEHLSFQEPKEKIKRNITLTPKTPAKTQNGKKATCNCKRTKCLKLYCDCFRDGQICGESCNCTDCHNLQAYQELRNNSMWTLMERNPDAFKPKIQEKQHSKGCRCKKSHCQKKYCECFQAGLKCGQHCKCDDCKNMESCNHTQPKQLKQRQDRIDIRSTIKKQRKYHQWADES